MNLSLNALDANISKDPEYAHSFMSHCDTITSVNFNSNGKQLVTSSLDQTILLWNLEDLLYKPIKLESGNHRINEASISPNGTLIASACSDNCIKLWDNSNMWKNHSFISIKAHNASVKTIDFSCDNKLLVSGSDDKSVRITSVNEKKVVANLTGHTNWLKSTRFSKNAKFILSCGDDKTVRYWDVSTQKNLNIFNHLGFVNSVRFHPDDSCFASGCYDKKIRIYDIRSNELVQIYSDHTGSINGIEFNPNGMYLASTSYDKSIKLWDLRKGECLYNLTGHSNTTNSVNFSFNGDMFATGSMDSLVILWNSNCITEKKTYKNTFNTSNTFANKMCKLDCIDYINKDSSKNIKNNPSEELSSFIEKMVNQMQLVTMTIKKLDDKLDIIENNLEKYNEIKNSNNINNSSIIERNKLINKFNLIKQQYTEEVNKLNEINHLTNQFS